MPKMFEISEMSNNWFLFDRFFSDQFCLEDKLLGKWDIELHRAFVGEEKVKDVCGALMGRGVEGIGSK